MVQSVCPYKEVGFDGADVGLDLLQGARWGIAVEVAVEVDLVADEADLTVLRIPLRRVDPGVRDVRPDLAMEEFLDALGERHAFSIAKFGIGIGVAFFVTADGVRFVAFR